MDEDSYWPNVDIIRLGVRHDRDVIRIRATFADILETGNLITWFHLRTAKRDYFVYAEREKSGKSWAFLAKEPDLGTCKGFSPDEIACDLDVVRDVKKDRVQVTFPRTCLGKPRWIRVGLDANGRFEGSRRFDRWGVNGYAPFDGEPSYTPRVKVTKKS